MCQVVFKVGFYPSKKKIASFVQCKPVINDEKCFLFYPKSSFLSQEINFFSWLFGHVEKTALLER